MITPQKPMEGCIRGNSKGDGMHTDQTSTIEDRGPKLNWQHMFGTSKMQDHQSNIPSNGKLLTKGSLSTL